MLSYRLVIVWMEEEMFYREYGGGFNGVGVCFRYK